METILVSGLSFYSYSVVADAVIALGDAADAATIAVSGLSSCCSAVADVAEIHLVDAANSKTEGEVLSPLLPFFIQRLQVKYALRPTMPLNPPLPEW